MAEFVFLECFTQFLGEFYHKTLESVNGNAVFSPISIQTALSLAMFRASGETLKEMKNTLKFEEISEESLLRNFQKLTENVRAGGLTMANKIYLMKNCEVKERFKEIAVKNFQSDAESVDFAKNVETAKKINEWVEFKTNNKIKELIKEDSLSSDTRLVLVNAIYFKADWVHPFNPFGNFKGLFYLNDQDSVVAEYMTQREYFHFGKFDELDATAVKLFYKSSNVTMLFILPNSRTGLTALESKLQRINFNNLSNRMSRMDIELTIPKFRIEFDVNLEEPLQKLGMARMFSDAAEFDNLLKFSEPLKVSQVVHKAFIEVNEKGTEAAAATALGGSILSVPQSFVLNRPFMFALIKVSRVLFIGRKVE